MPKSNGFMLFCKSKRAEFEISKNRKLSLPELVKVAGPGWSVFCLLIFTILYNYENVDLVILIYLLLLFSCLAKKSVHHSMTMRKVIR